MCCAHSTCVCVYISFSYSLDFFFYFWRKKMSSLIFSVIYGLKVRKEKKSIHITSNTHRSEYIVEWRLFRSLCFCFVACVFLSLFTPLPMKCHIYAIFLDTLLQAAATSMMMVIKKNAVCHVLKCCIRFCLIFIHFSCLSVTVYVLVSRYIYPSLWHLMCVLALKWNEWGFKMKV